MASPSAETDTVDPVDSFDPSERHSDTETDEDTTNSVQRSEQLIAKKNTKSPVWMYFGFPPDEDGRPTNYCNPRCKLCSKDVLGKFSNTSNLLKHLRLHHRKEFSEITRAQSAESRSVKLLRKNKSIQPTLRACLDQSRKYSTNSKEHRRLTDAVTNFIVRDAAPIYTVEKEGFCEMVDSLNPRYQLPHKDYFSRIAIPELYERTREQIAAKVKKESCYFSATTDLWSSCSSDPYLCITIHYIDPEWNLQSYCLQANYMPESHTGEHLQDALSTSLAEWGLDSTKLVAITTDNGSNIKLACELLTWMRVSCFGHNLDLAINKGLNDTRINRVIGLCRKVVSFFSYSWKRQKELREAQQQKNLPEKKLKGDVVTRWGSKVEMMQRIMEQQDAIHIVLSQDRKVSHLVPTWQDFDILESVLEAVKDFSDLTDLLSGEKRVTCSAIKPLIDVINMKIVVSKTSDTPLTVEINEHIKRDLETRYQSKTMSLLLDTCAFLDPHFKDRFSMEDEPVVKLMDEVKAYGDQNEVSKAGERSPKKKGKFSSIFGTTSPPSSTSMNAGTTSVSNQFKREFEMYLQYPSLYINESPL